MKTIVSGIVFWAALAGYAYAQSDVFLCVDDRGNKEYKNIGGTKGCKRVELPGITTIAAPRRPVVAQTASAKPSSSPADFPKVDSGTQKARDTDRRQILLDEMKAEEQKLADLKKEYNNGEPERRADERNAGNKYHERVAAMKDDVNRTEKNVEALKRELGNLK